MYIEPNSTIRLLNNVPLDNTYEHTIYFSSATAQVSYFSGKTKYTFDRNSYQRVKRGYSRVNIKADSIYDCNYMMFQNTSYGNKWFYAFIKSVEFINNQCSEIQFEIDVMQTWHFDYTFRKTFVEREHSAIDRIGDHLLPEPVEIGDYIYNGNFVAYDLSDNVPIVCRAYDHDLDTGVWEEHEWDGYITQYNGVLCGVKYTPLTDTNRDKIEEYFYKLIDTKEGVDKTNSILSIYLAPRKFLENGQIVGENVAEEVSDAMSRPTEIDGYTPRNKKLLTFPYSYLQLSDNCGNTADYRYEFFKDPDAFRFTFKCTLINDPAVGAFPNAYNTSENTTAINSEEGFIMTGFPQMAFTCDSYRAWVASGGRFENRMNAVNGVAQGAGQIVGGAMSIGSASDGDDLYTGVTGIVNGAMSATESVMSAYKTGQVMEGRGNTVKGNTSATLLACMGYKNIYLHKRSIRRHYAEIIDDFFDMYGYACNRLKAPNRASRPHWNYVKTKSCTIEGSVPVDDSAIICRIYNNGITFWKHGDEVGNYSLDNTPT